jgi:Transposase DDE domain
MSRHDPLSDWTDVVATQFPHLSQPQAAVLALWSFGLVLARCCTLPAVANPLSPRLGRCSNTVRQRLREGYKAAPEKAGPHRRELDVATGFAPLLAWILKDWPCPRVALALEATRLADRWTVLSLSRVSRGTALPVAWTVLRGNRPHAWKPEWLKLVRWFADQIDPTWTVIVTTDRGPDARWLFPARVAWGWHPPMHVTRRGQFLPEGWDRPQEFWQFVPHVGRTRQGRGVAFPREPERRLTCTLLACWAEGHEDGWYLLTDLPPQAADAAWYGLRMWIEHGFEQCEATGWQWQETRIAAPDRARRMWLAIALATLWVVAVGGEHDHDEGSPETMPDLPHTDSHKRGPERSGANRLVSVFCPGIAPMLALPIKGQNPLPEKWYPEPWPGVEILIQDREHEQPSKP